MKTIIAIILTALSIAICQGQNNFLFKKEKPNIQCEPLFQNQVLNPTHFYRDLQEQVDSSHTRDYSSFLDAWSTSHAAYFTYTNEHLLATEKYLDIDQDDNEVYQGIQDEYFYNEFGLWNLRYSSMLDIESGIWKRTDREEVVYNEDLLPVEHINSSWEDATGQFLFSSKGIATFTPTKKTQDVISYQWDGQAWQPRIKYNYEYNSADSLSILNSYTWMVSTGTWRKDYYQQYFYTDDIRLDSILEFWNQGNGLEPYNRKLVQYNAQGLIEFETGFDWNNANWVPSWQDKYEYLPEGLLTLDTYYEWDEDEQTFIRDFQEEITYTPDFDPSLVTYSEFDIDSNFFIPSEKYLLVYDENVNGSTIVWPNAPNYEAQIYNKKPLFAVTSFYDFNQWYDVDTTIIFYGGLVSSTNAVKPFHGNLYPNPASIQVHVEMENLVPGATIHFYDTQGKLVLQSSLEADNPVPISRLQPGSYVFRIQNGKEWYSGKVIKE